MSDMFLANIFVGSPEFSFLTITIAFSLWTVRQFKYGHYNKGVTIILESFPVLIFSNLKLPAARNEAAILRNFSGVLPGLVVRLHAFIVALNTSTIACYNFYQANKTK